MIGLRQRTISVYAQSFSFDATTNTGNSLRPLRSMQLLQTFGKKLIQLKSPLAAWVHIIGEPGKKNKAYP